VDSIKNLLNSGELRAIPVRKKKQGPRKKTQPKRDAVTGELMKKILKRLKDELSDPKVTETKTYMCTRTLCSCVLLYISGYRVSNLLVLKKYHIIELFNQQLTRVDIIKGGQKRQALSLTEGSQKFLMEHKKYFDFLLNGKGPEDFLSSSITEKLFSFVRKLKYVYPP